jgi:hypothetical protein
MVKDKFHDRFGFEPAEVREVGAYTFVGPTPQRDFDWIGDDNAD